ncbi:MAG: acetamidase [Clostridia bacterium]|nr:acetamidase [Clostridia bacterium]NCC43887.1 acetamidase [Clostridia bacterium]
MIIQGKTIYAMSAANEPAAKVNSGTTMTFITKDCFNNQLLGEDAVLDALDWSAINPATGPVYIEEAEPGDILKIKIEDIKVAECGTMAAIPDNGVLGALVMKGVLKQIPVHDGVAEFGPDIKIPCKPMIGVIGVAPEQGEIPCGEPGCHGGNMDNTRIAAGATLYLPVFHKGALLAMGDVHACMGDGEIMVTGLEIPAEVTVTVEVVKGQSIENPMLEDEESYYTIASDADVEQAVFTAVRDMTEIVMRKKDMSFEEAGMLLSAMGNLQFCQVVDPKRTVRMEMKRCGDVSSVLE